MKLHQGFKKESGYKYSKKLLCGSSYLEPDKYDEYGKDIHTRINSFLFVSSAQDSPVKSCNITITLKQANATVHTGRSLHPVVQAGLDYGRHLITSPTKKQLHL